LYNLHRLRIRFVGSPQQELIGAEGTGDSALPVPLDTLLGKQKPCNLLRTPGVLPSSAELSFRQPYWHAVST
jgi:hypothetical protein